MATTEGPLIVGVFESEYSAKKALEELRTVGFSDDQIELAMLEGSQANSPVRDRLVAAGISETDADYYEREFEAGHIIETVRADARQNDALSILQRNGAYNAATGPTFLSKLSDFAATRAQTGDEQEQILQLREEQLQVKKQWIEGGYVLIRKKVITEEKTFQVSVSREEVVIERYPQANQDPVALEQVSTGEAQILKLEVGETISIPVRAEKVIIQKQPMIVEEIVISKQLLQEVQQVSDSVQREVPRIDREGDVVVRGIDAIS